MGRFSNFIRASIRLASVSADSLLVDGIGVSDPDGEVMLISILDVASTKVVWLFDFQAALMLKIKRQNACNQNSTSDLPDEFYIDSIISFRPLYVLVSS